MADVSAAFLVFDVLFDTPCLRNGVALDGEKRFPIGSLAGKGAGKELIDLQAVSLLKKDFKKCCYCKLLNTS